MNIQEKYDLIGGNVRPSFGWVAMFYIVHKAEAYDFYHRNFMPFYKRAEFVEWMNE